MPTKLFNQVKSAVSADLQENLLACNGLEALIFDFLSEVAENSSRVNTAEEWDALELHDMQQGEVW
jgi:hypothetical protein